MKRSNETVTARATISARDLTHARVLATESFKGFFDLRPYTITSETAEPEIVSFAGVVEAWSCEFEAESPS